MASNVLLVCWNAILKRYDVRDECDRLVASAAEQHRAIEAALLEARLRRCWGNAIRVSVGRPGSALNFDWCS